MRPNCLQFPNVALAALALAALALPCAAGTGSVDPSDGTIDFTAKFTFPPDQDDIDLFKAAVTEASAILCDATDGEMRLGTVTLTGGSMVGFDQADMLVYLKDARSTSDICWEGAGQACFALETLGQKIKLYRDPVTSTFDADTIAHELGHLVFDLSEDYDEQSRMGACWGIGRSIECSDLSATNNSIMQGNDPACAPFSDITELTVASNHDTVGGDPLFPACTALEDIPCQPDRPCEDNCQFWNIATCRYEMSSQSAWSLTKFGSILSDWEHLALTHPFVTPPNGLPEPAPDGSCATGPGFVEDLQPADQVVFVLDRSWSMNFSPSIGQCDVAGCPDLCSNNFDDDKDGFADELDPEGCLDHETRMDFLREAANAFLYLHRGGTFQTPTTVSAALTSFNCGATPDLDMLPVTSWNHTNEFYPVLTGLAPGGNTAIGDGIAFGAQQFPGGEDESQHKAILLITDGHNNCGNLEPEEAADQLEGIPVFFIPVGAASDSDVLGAIPQQTGGKNVDSADSRELVSALVQQWSNYAGAGQVIPRLPFAVNTIGTLQDPATRRTPDSWLTGESAPVGCPPSFPCFNDRIEFDVEENVSQLTIALAGNMDSMTGFGVRALFTGPAGPNPSSYDSDAVAFGPTIRVRRDGFWLIVQLRKPNPGTWTVEIQPRGLPGEPQVQTGNLTVIAESERGHLATTLDRAVVTDPLVPVQLSIMPSFETTILGVMPQVRVFRPDGSSEPIAVVDRTAFRAGYTAEIANLPFQGRYEVRVLVDTPPTAIADPGEPLFGDEPAPTSVPPLVRAASEYFYVTTGAKFCPGGSADCDGDGIVGESGVNDPDGDGLPDDCDTDSDGDQTPDDIEWNGALVDTDGDGSSDPYDTDADGDGTNDEDDPAVDPGAAAHLVSLGDAELAGCGGRIYAHLGSDEPVRSLDLGLSWDPTAVAVSAIRLGPDVNPAEVALFNVRIGAPGLAPGEALVDLDLVAPATLGPANGLRILEIDVDPLPVALVGATVPFCFADNLGTPSEDTTVTVVRVGGTVTVTPSKACGLVTIAADDVAPEVSCVDTVVAAGPTCTATWNTTPAASDNCNPAPDVRTSPGLPQTYGLGDHVVTATATDDSGNTAECETVVTVADLTPPTGSITSPAYGLCTMGPVLVADDFGDACDPSVSRMYDPPGGPLYAAHGDHDVTLVAADDQGNEATDFVAFTIDLVPPTIRIDSDLVALDLPSSPSFGDVFVATDADSAIGNVVAERLYLDDCPIYDGDTYGDGDGLLSDETMVFDAAIACEALARCGLAGFDATSLRVEADDCAGNTGAATKSVPLSAPLGPVDCVPSLSIAKLSGGEADLNWTPVFDADAWDLVRGDLAALAPGSGGTVDLGAVTCLGDNLTTTSHTDADTPPPGTSYFYVLRYHHAATLSPYGYSSTSTPRTPTSGDCPP